MNYLRDITWQEIWEQWKQDEEHLEHWQEFMQKNNLDSWEQWRRTYLKDLPLQECEWKLYKLMTSEVPEINCGAFTGWLKRAEEHGSRQFKAFAHLESWSSHRSGSAIIDAIKTEKLTDIFLIGVTRIEEVKTISAEDIYLIEGHHRSAVMSALLHQQYPLKVNVNIALTNLPLGQKYPFIDYRPPTNWS